MLFNSLFCSGGLCMESYSLLHSWTEQRRRILPLPIMYRCIREDNEHALHHVSFLETPCSALHLCLFLLRSSFEWIMLKMNRNTVKRKWVHNLVHHNLLWCTSIFTKARHSASSNVTFNNNAGWGEVKHHNGSNPTQEKIYPMPLISLEKCQFIPAEDLLLFTGLILMINKIPDWYLLLFEVIGAWYPHIII